MVELTQGKHHLVCMISPDDRRRFIEPVTDLLEQVPLAVTWLDHPSSITAAHLLKLGPDILLTGWSTPPLSEQWLNSPQCSLRYICHLTGSVRRIVPRRFIDRGGLVTNWGDIPSRSVAEQALLLALAALRNLARWPEVILRPGESAHRVEWLGTRSLYGRSIGIHGFGRVARALLRLLEAFGGAVRAYSAGVPESVIRAEGVVSSNSLEALFSHSEVLFECEALTPATKGTVTAEALAALPDGAVFVNVGRGGLVDETALLREAGSGRIRIALDVVVNEPLTPESPFCRTLGAVLSPHIAGPTFDQYAQCGDLALRNLLRYARGEKLAAVVSSEDYERTTLV